MASSGSFSTNAYSNRSLTFSWSVSSTSIESNYKVIYWELRGSGSQTQWFKTGPISVDIDGANAYYSTDRIQLDNGTLVASGYKTIYHNPDGSRQFTVNVSAAVYSTSVNCNGTGTWELDPISRQATLTSFYTIRNGVTTWDWFTDECTPCVEFYNPAGNAVTVKTCMSWTGGDDITYREARQEALSAPGYYRYKFNFTDAERNALRAAASNSTNINVVVYITTWIGGTPHYSTRTVNFQVINCTPTLNPTVTDYGTSSTKFTGNNQTMIKGYNSLKAIFNATALKGASIVSRTVTSGGTTKSGDCAFDYWNYNTFEFTVTDSRGLSATKTITVPMVNHIPVNCDTDYNTELTADNTATIHVTLSGSFFNGSFGAQNNVLDLQYRCRKSNEDWPKYDDGVYKWEQVPIASVTYSGGKYSYTFSITNVNYKERYVIQAWAADTINPSGIYAKEQTISVTPVFDWGEDDFNFNVPVNFNDSVNFGEPTLLCESIGVNNDVRTFAHGINVDINLNDSITNYKTIEVLYTANNWDHYIQSVRMRVGYQRGWNTGDSYGNILTTWVPNEYVVFLFPTTNTIRVTGAPNTCHIVGVYGWKY